MSLSNAGFDGTVTELPFAFMWGVGVGGDSVESAAAWAVTQGTGRQVSVAAQNGYAFGHGILSKETSAAILQALSTPVAGGWFLICRHIDWTTNTVSVVALTGPTSTTTVPTAAPADYSGVSGMSTSPGVTYDHPLAWAWVRNTDTTMALFDLRKLPLFTRMAAAESALIANVADLDALVLLSATSFEGRIINVDELNVNFQAQDGVWVQQGVARVATAAARTTAYAKASGQFLVQGAVSRRDDAVTDERYWTAYNAGTNPLSPLRVTGWTSTQPSGRFKGTMTTSKVVTSAAIWGKTGGTPLFDSTDDPDAGFSATTGFFTVQKGGLYLINMQGKQSTSVAFSLVVSRGTGGGAQANILQSGNTPAAAFTSIVMTGYARLLPGDTIAAFGNTTYTSQSDSPSDNNFIELVQVQA